MAKCAARTNGMQAFDERAVGLSADPVSQTFWIYTDRSILEVLVRNEDRDVWRAKLDHGDFAEALRFARVRTPFDRETAAELIDCPATRYRAVAAG